MGAHLGVLCSAPVLGQAAARVVSAVRREQVVGPVSLLVVP